MSDHGYTPTNPGAPAPPPRDPGPADPTPLIRYRRDALVTVLTHHQRFDIGHCMCGWGVDTGNAGQSHAAHVCDVYEQLIKPRKDYP